MLKTEDIKNLIIHCSDTPDMEDIGALEIHKMHLGFGWEGIGYHYIIRKNGKIENGRPEFWIGAHTYGLNKKSLGICLIGRNNFSKEQFKSLHNLLLNCKKKYPEAIIKGHSQAIETNKTCPNFDVKAWCKERNLS